jgi:hypothetical protein
LPPNSHHLATLFPSYLASCGWLPPWAELTWGTSAWGFWIFWTSCSACSTCLWSSSLAVSASFICSWSNCKVSWTTSRVFWCFTSYCMEVRVLSIITWEAGYLWIELFNQCCLCHQGIVSL